MELPAVLGRQNVDMCQEAANQAAEELSLYGAKIAIVQALDVLESSGKYSSVSFLGVWEEAGDGFKSRHYMVRAKTHSGLADQVCILPARGELSRSMASRARAAESAKSDSADLVRVGELLSGFLSSLSGVQARVESEAWMRALGDAVLGVEASSRWRSQRERAQLSVVAHAGSQAVSSGRI